MTKIRLFERFTNENNIISALQHFNDAFLDLFDVGFEIGIRVGTSYTFIGIDFSVSGTTEYIESKIGEIQYEYDDALRIEIRGYKPNLHKNFSMFIDRKSKMENMFNSISEYDCELFDIELHSDDRNYLYDIYDVNDLIKAKDRTSDLDIESVKIVYRLTI